MGTKAITKTIEANTLAMPQVLPQDKYELAKSIAAKGASDAEFQLLVHMANKYQLDPLAKQIWCIKRNPNQPALIMASRDGYLEIAHRSGQFDGMESGTIDDEKGTPIKAWCTVYRKDMSHPFKAEVKYKEYVQASPTWQKYPSAMLIKVAEVFALKRAFSISGMVTQEEIENEVQETVVDTKPGKIEIEVVNAKEPEVVEAEDTSESLDVLYEWLQKASEAEGKDISVLADKLEETYGDIDALNDETLQSIINKLEKKYG